MDTIDKGLILSPNSSKLKIDCYVDADFAGLWGYADKQDPSCVKSRTGYIIFIANCPVVWISRLQTDIATSTMEVKYNALSIAMRDILPLKHLVQEIATTVGLLLDHAMDIVTTVHEDNNGVQHLAEMEPELKTPRSKHYGVKYHWFCSKLKPENIRLKQVETAKQKADFLTKALRAITFEGNRKLTMGW